MLNVGIDIIPNPCERTGCLSFITGSNPVLTFLKNKTKAMTRINIHIPPRNLCNQHLLAEHREIKRIPNTIRSGKAVVKDIPKVFTLGSGHVKFFYNKLGYLQERYSELYKECKERGFDVSDYSDCFSGIDKIFFGQINFRQQEKDIVIKRIEEKLGNMKNIHYLCSKITSEQAIKILNQ